MDTLDLTIDSCPVVMTEQQVVLFNLPACSACEKVKRILQNNQIEFNVVDLRQCNRAVGLSNEVYAAPTLLRKAAGKIEVIL